MKNKHSNILIIEDNQDVLNAITSILDYYGYPSISLTRFSEDIFGRLKSEKISLIILDVMLSGNDGRNLVRIFKERRETKGVPIVMISAYPNLELSVKKAGADDFIQKPFGIDELIQKVEHHIKNGMRQPESQQKGI